ARRGANVRASRAAAPATRAERPSRERPPAPTSAATNAHVPRLRAPSSMEHRSIAHARQGGAREASAAGHPEPRRYPGEMSMHPESQAPSEVESAPARAREARSAAAISRLRREHRNIERLLTYLESELGRMSGGEDIDDALVLDAFTYLTEYVDRIHHT